MIELVQIAYSPYCLVQRRILEYSGARFKVINVPNGDRSLIWRLTKERYYHVPVVKDGKSVVFETDDNSQVIAKYLDSKLGLGLFPREWEGVQSILWRYFENDIESTGFKLNDIYYQENLPRKEWVPFIRHKERKFGRGCLQLWREQQAQLQAQLVHQLLPCEEMLIHHKFLLGEQPLFVDFDLYGMLANYLYSGHHAMPDAHTHLNEWYGRMSKLRFISAA